MIRALVSAPVLPRATVVRSIAARCLQLHGGASRTPEKMPVTPTAATVDVMKCMGDWYVQVAVPTPFDKGAHNGLEQYVWNPRKQQVDVKYTFNDGSFSGKQTAVYQKGRVNPANSSGAQWQVKPWLGLFYLPFWLDYTIIDVDTSSHLVASSPETTGFGAWLYIMTRQKKVSEDFLNPLRASAAKAGWDMSRAQRVPQGWCALSCGLCVVHACWLSYRLVRMSFADG